MALQTLFPNIHQPIVKGRNGFFTIIFGRQSIRQKIFTVLLTKLGERVHLPDFGSRLFELVFEQSDATFDVLAKQYVIDAIRIWVTEIEILAVFTKHNEDNSVNITIQYRIRQQIAQNDSLTLTINRDTVFSVPI